MSDGQRRIDLGLTGDGHPVILLGTTGGQAQDVATLLRLAPDLTAPGHATDLAMAVNHLAHGSDYRVITDPAGFEQAYRARLAREDAHAEWQEGVVRLSDFGIPDFRTIQPPRQEGPKLVFFAADSFLGVPYRVETADVLKPPSYTPLPLTPVATPSGRSGAKLTAPASPDDDAARRTEKPGDRPPP